MSGETWVQIQMGFAIVHLLFAPKLDCKGKFLVVMPSFDFSEGKIRKGNHEFFGGENGFGEVCWCEKYLTRDLKGGITAIGMLGNVGYFNGRNVDMMGLKYSTISASVRFLGVFAKHCYDQRS